MNIFEEAQRDMRRALELDDQEAAKEVARQFYRHLLKFSPGDIAHKLGQFLENGELGSYYNALEALSHQWCGYSDSDIAGAEVTIVDLERMAVGLSGYSSMN